MTIKSMGENEENKITRVFPGYFPDNCPPEDSIVTTMEVFHFVKGDISTSDTFVPYKLSKPDRVEPGNECIGCGISVFSSLSKAKKMRSNFPVFRNWKLSKGTLTENCWRIKRTPPGCGSGHMTLWCYEGIVIRNYFELIEEE